MLVFKIAESLQCIIKDTHGENTFSNKTEALTKSMNMNILVIGALDQLLIRDSYTKIKLRKKMK